MESVTKQLKASKRMTTKKTKMLTSTKWREGMRAVLFDRKQEESDLPEEELNLLLCKSFKSVVDKKLDGTEYSEVFNAP